MLASISPVGEASRRQRWPVTVTAYLLGSGLGGAAVGLAAGALGAGLLALTGPVPLAARLAALAFAAAAAVAVDRGIVPVRAPSWQRQVDERWLTTYRGWVYGLGFGLQLGSGLATRVTTSAVWVMLAAAVASGSLRGGAVIGAAFGLVRAAPLLATAPLREPGQLRRFHQRMDAQAGVAAVTTDLTLIATAVLTATLAVVR